MSLDISGFEDKAKNAVKVFWGTRDAAKAKQEESGKADQGERSGVTAGKNLDGFIGLFTDVITANGLDESTIHLKRKVLTLPGYFRPTKMWDMLVVHNSELVAAIELKSQVGPSFGNNFNNRTEEALGTAIDLDTAYREGAFGQQPSPFVGWLMLLEDTDASRSPVSNAAPHFSVFPEFDGASYAKRYHLLCRKMMQEKHYTSAALMLTKREQAASGEYSEVDSMTGLKTFLSELAGHVAAAVARHND